MTVRYPTEIDENEPVPPCSNMFLGNKKESATLEASDLEPFTLVDEMEFSRRFRDIVNLAEDDSDDVALLHANVSRLADSLSGHRHTTSLDQSESNPGFNSKLLPSLQLSLDSHTTSYKHQRSVSHQPSPRRPAQEKSFLDDDWLLSRVENDSNMAAVAAGLVRPRSALHFDERYSTPIGTSSHTCSTNHSANSSPSRIDELCESVQGRSKHLASTHNNPPPKDYVCKLCTVSGHWLKDCALFEPREGIHGGRPSVASKLKSLAPSSVPAGHNMHKSNGPPPGNYVCRLCGVSGHWIEQCSQFQHKPEPKHNHGTKERPACFKSIPPPPGYTCNLCHQRGHWLQQCARFEPMPAHRRKDQPHHR